MKQKARALVALILVLCLTLTGCAGVDFAGYFENVLMLLLGTGLTPFQDMVYTRPDMEWLKTEVDACCQDVAEAGSLYEVISIIYTAYEPIDAFSTAYALSNIYYSKDLTDTYWAEEYAFCSENAAIAQAALDQFYRALAQCAFREELEGDEYFGAGFFDDYDGDSIYDETFTAMLAQEGALESEYYALWNEAGETDSASEEFYTQYGDQMAQLFIELVALRQDMAEYLGYASYPEFAYDYYYGRDYTCDETTAYLADIRAELAPMYHQWLFDYMASSSGPSITVGPCDGAGALEYIRGMAAAMGGTVNSAYQDMINFKLYDIDYSVNKYDASFEVFISGYHSPYLFINPTLTEYDKLTLAHEFGHFCCDYAAGGSAAGVDVAEVFSQGMEYLSLYYADDTQNLAVLKMADSLSIMIQQAAFASFEQQVYLLEEAELTTDNVQALFAQMCEAYGMGGLGIDGRSYVQINHFFTNPLYVISYVVSNDVALQLYQLEGQTSGAGLAAMNNAFTTTHTGIVAFTQEFGLESPFAAGRIARIKETIQTVLNL